jgi:hypothetical protein
VPFLLIASLVLASGFAGFCQRRTAAGFALASPSANIVAPAFLVFAATSHPRLSFIACLSHTSSFTKIARVALETK